MTCQMLLRSTDCSCPATVVWRDTRSPALSPARGLRERSKADTPHERVLFHRPAGEDLQIAWASNQGPQFVHDAHDIPADVVHLVGRQGFVDELTHVDI